MPLHETNRLCINCVIRSVLTEFGRSHGYTSAEVLQHLVDITADIAASNYKDGRGESAQSTLRQMFAEYLADAFQTEAQRRAEQTAGPKEPTTADVGHG